MKQTRPRQMTANSSSLPPFTIQSPPQKDFMKLTPQFQHQNQNQNQNQNSMLSKINLQIKLLDQTNRQLYNVADKIKSINSMNNVNFNMPVLENIKKQFQHSLQQLVQSIMEFHVDIDKKLINLGQVVYSELNKVRSSPNLQTENTIRPNSDNNDKFEILADRIRSLQISLRETQLNEKKLVQVIENLMQRYEVNDQPTLIRQTPSLNNQFKRNRIPSTVPSNSENIVREDGNTNKRKTNFQIGNYMKPENRNKSIYENLYTIEQSIVNEEPELPQKFRLRQIEQQSEGDQTYIRKLYSKNSHQHLGDKKSLKNQNQGLQSLGYNSIIKQRSTASQSSMPDDKQHRLNFMMQKLNL